MNRIPPAAPSQTNANPTLLGSPGELSPPNVAKPPRKRDGIAAWLEWHSGKSLKQQRASLPTSPRVSLTRGYSALVDSEDVPLVSQFSWRVKIDNDGRKYAIGHLRGHNKSIFMHRLILGVTDPVIKVDHWDGDGLNNRRRNLRLSTNAQNVRNQKPHRDKKTAKLKGVYKQKNGQYRAQIMIDRKKINLGSYATEEVAGAAYDSAALELHGDFARLNTPEAKTWDEIHRRLELWNQKHGRTRKPEGTC